VRNLCYIETRNPFLDKWWKSRYTWQNIGKPFVERAWFGYEHRRTDTMNPIEIVLVYTLVPIFFIVLAVLIYLVANNSILPPEERTPEKQEQRQKQQEAERVSPQVQKQ